MARNQEKQQGKLNRLWLQKERDEGRLKDVHERRPKLSTLNSAASLKKWIPSIKNEIEYYLQQSQLSHYPERKIAEFQLHMEALEREYKRFIAKLRAADPGCKHTPWTPRAYCRRRADTRESPAHAAPPRPPESRGGDSAGGGTGRRDPSAPESRPPPGVQTPADQDRPLSFDRARLAVAAAAFRGPPPPPQGGSSSSSRTLAQVLHSGLPNLSSASARRGGAAEDREDHAGTTGHVPGLDCYSSSDEEP